MEVDEQSSTPRPIAASQAVSPTAPVRALSATPTNPWPKKLPPYISRGNTDLPVPPHTKKVMKKIKAGYKAVYTDIVIQPSTDANPRWLVKCRLCTPTVWFSAPVIVMQRLTEGLALRGSPAQSLFADGPWLLGVELNAYTLGRHQSSSRKPSTERLVLKSSAHSPLAKTIASPKSGFASCWNKLAYSKPGFRQGLPTARLLNSHQSHSFRNYVYIPPVPVLNQPSSRNMCHLLPKSPLPSPRRRRPLLVRVYSILGFPRLPQPHPSGIYIGHSSAVRDSVTVERLPPASRKPPLKYPLAFPPRPALHHPRTTLTSPVGTPV
ncbi:uncharacterized protein BXZ73DRAFT_79571 [Epithele typhae]|uniref:uncharacterized protein n=1 Tax=Epithele typhae TaxID=378194 RepID=UPI00200837DB|nr:uncharacterized protein BXZ73DRAFT_79571 [Epithele typhae]KAH9923156.1 hypothetical protein BXZ73DRAFT_79571 [Epithele typhae]